MQCPDHAVNIGDLKLKHNIITHMYVVNWFFILQFNIFLKLENFKVNFILTKFSTP